MQTELYRCFDAGGRAACQPCHDQFYGIEHAQTGEQ